MTVALPGRRRVTVSPVDTLGFNGDARKMFCETFARLILIIRYN